MLFTGHTTSSLSCFQRRMSLCTAQRHRSEGHLPVKRQKAQIHRDRICAYTADRYNAESTSGEEDDWLASDEDADDEYEDAGSAWTNPNSLQTATTEFEQSEEESKKNAESRAFAVAMAKIAWDTKAEDISVLHVAPLVYWCSYMVLVTIKSRPQMQAVVGKIEQQAEQQWGRKINELASGMRGSDWEAIDLMDVVIHVFTAEQREKYQLDAYYGMAEEVQLPFLEERDTGLQWSTKKTLQ